MQLKFLQSKLYENVKLPTQSCVLTVQTAQKYVVVPQVQFLGKADDVPVVVRRPGTVVAPVSNGMRTRRCGLGLRFRSSWCGARVHCRMSTGGR